jgi:hypothetical protein
MSAVIFLIIRLNKLRQTYAHLLFKRLELGDALCLMRCVIENKRKTKENE